MESQPETEKEDFKKYATLKNNDVEYINLIENNPKQIFSLISDERIRLWEEILYKTESPSFITNDAEILSTTLDLETQKIIKNDCLRTRVKESVLVPGFLNILEEFITFYCKKNKILYKQGLNEILGPFILLRFKFKNISMMKIYNMAKCFISKFLVNYYVEEKFFSLYSSLNLFVILLRFHAPEIYNVLDTLMILPEMYATSWIMTMMSSKCRLDILYQLYDHILQNNDTLFFHFFMVAFLIKKKEVILKTDSTLIPSLMSNISIVSVEEVDSIIQTALELRKQTPYSFRILANKLELFKKGSKNLQAMYELYKPDTISAMPIFPSEIFYITYKSTIKCPDEDCEFMKNLRKKVSENTQKGETLNSKKKDQPEEKHICEHCDMKIYKQINYVLLDLRILEYGSFDSEDEKTGFLPMMIMIPQEDLKLDDFPDVITDRFIPDKGNYQFVLLTSKTDYFKDFEDNFYSEKISEKERKSMMWGIQKKIDKEVDFIKASGMIKTQKDVLKLKEYDNLRLTILSMLKENFPYISFAYGGYNMIHNESFKYDISLLNHEEKDCILCEINKMEARHKSNSLITKFKDLFKNKDSKDKRLSMKEENSTQSKNAENESKNQFTLSQKIAMQTDQFDLWQHKIKIKYSELNDILSDQKNFVSFCVLKEYAEVIYEEETTQILVVLLFDQKVMKLYQLDKKKFDSSKPTITNKGNKAVRYNPDIHRQKELEFGLLENIPIDTIISISPSKKAKNVLTISFYKEINSSESPKHSKSSKPSKPKKKEIHIVIDLTSPKESKRFMKVVKDVWQRNSVP